MIQDYIDMDTHKIRYVSESSNTSTSGYSTMSPGSGAAVGNLSPASVSSMPGSPAQSPRTAAMQSEFNNLILPSAVNLPQQQRHLKQQPQLSYAQPQLHQQMPDYKSMVYLQQNSNGTAMKTLGLATSVGGGHAPLQYVGVQQTQHPSASQFKEEFPAELHILEHPVEKFRFRYKSEMHGTHGSLNGANSKRTPKTFPEVELRNFNERAVIRCSLFQTTTESPHSHQLVVRKDDMDICDPHDLWVSPDCGWVAQFQNMGIIHTAKKFIFDELLKKKMSRMLFELGRDDLSVKQQQELHKETEKEAKEMNLNQVRLCFEAFKEEENKTFTRIAAPVYTNAINNRKSAQTGELRICRLSIATGSVAGSDDLILLVEKVSKKNIRVRFYELDEDEEVVWEAQAKFRESDVHHQYAIVCQTPPYRDKNIDKPVEVFVELVRPTDDERSYPPVTFRYKPRDVIASRKRRRTYSTATSNSGSGNSISSLDLPKPVQEQTATAGAMLPPSLETTPTPMAVCSNRGFISEEFDKSGELQKLLINTDFRGQIECDSEELMKYCEDMPMWGSLEQDGHAGSTTTGVGNNSSGYSNTNPMLAMQQKVSHADHRKKLLLKALNASTLVASANGNATLTRILRIFDELRKTSDGNEAARMADAGEQVARLFTEYAERNEHGDSFMHEVIAGDNTKLAIRLCQIFSQLKLTGLLNRTPNTNGETALHYACLHDRPHFIRPLMRLGCNPNIQDNQGNTALHIAIKEQYSKCIDCFFTVDMKVGLHLSLRNDEGLTPLHLAVRSGNCAVAAKLLECDRSTVYVSNTKDGNNALHMAVLQQSLPLVNLMVKEQNVGDLLRRCNAAGLTAFELAKNIGAKSGLAVVTCLASLQPDVIDESSIVTVKEEEPSSSSTEDESEPMDITTDIKEEQEWLDEATPTTSPAAIADETIKQETKNEDVLDDDEDAGADSAARCTQTLENALKDEAKFEALVARLNTGDGKWRTIAHKSHMQHRLCLWNNARDMLIYMRKNASASEYSVFAAALDEIDHGALHILQNT